MINSVEIIYKKFENSINWNGFFYMFQKTLTLIFTFILYKHVPINDFAAWINIYNIIFFTLLWVDFGFKKSVPKFIPEFSKNRLSHNSFVKFIIKQQFLIMIFAALCLFLFINPITSFLGIKLTKQITYLTIILFFFEWSIALLRLIYHSHFWNKEFEVRFLIVGLFESIINICLICFLSHYKLIYFFVLKLISASTIIYCSSYKLIYLLSNKEYSTDCPIDYNCKIKDFLNHSKYMWFSVILKSLADRNFLIPMLTFALGPASASIFKIANDWALMFPKLIVRTIGTSDTSLLSYINSFHKDFIHQAMEKIILAIMRLFTFLFIAFIFIVIGKQYIIGNNQVIFILFMILSIFYLLESLLSPYERFLEVSKEYLILMLSNIPYLFFLYLFLSKAFLRSIDLYSFALSVGLIRLLCAIVLFSYARKKYLLNMFFARK